MRLRQLSFRNVITSSLLVFTVICHAQDSAQYRMRKTIVIGSNTIAYSALMVGLNNLWYKDYPSSAFHFHNDNKDWLQMDKVGHMFSCYNEGRAGIEMMKWAGFTQKQYSIIGGSYGFFIQTGVEVLDGFSAEWGASMGDVTANTIGAGLAISQSLVWDEQRILLKYSFEHSPYAAYRPNLLGSNIPERILKDYNGQTYWLSGNINAFAPTSKWPKWLNIALGYGADGMVGGNDNRFTSESRSYDFTTIFKRSRQFYISPDIDFTRIQTKRKGIHSLLIIANCIKFPMPALEYHTEKGISGHWLMF